jgi:glycine/D-amino acid oxidase-like deaminating enzyme
MTLPNLNTFSPLASPFGQKVSARGSKKDHIVVTGAGAFGGWSALYLLRKGFKVTLVDAWGAGNARSSSGDETRVIRSTYGANEFYFDLNVRALALWKENQERFGKQLFYNTGVLWLCHEEKTPLVDDSIPFARKHGMEYEYLSVEALKKRYGVLNVHDLHHGYFDPYGGYLKAREACQHVQEAFVNEGGHFIQGWVKPGKLHAGKLTGLSLSNGLNLTADAYLFACGPWLNQLFPDVKNSLITCTKQELYYFGVPHDQATGYDNFPVWVDVDGRDFYYGIPGNDHRGFKIGVDIRGGSFDPTSGEHAVTAEVLAHARNFLAHRFPSLRNAPLLESRVCPYESSPDGNFIFEPHPDASNVIFLGGGSGHGFKHGPALGELVASRLSD